MKTQSKEFEKLMKEIDQIQHRISVSPNFTPREGLKMIQDLVIKYKAKMETAKFYARKCSITEKGMNQGWCWGDGSFYTSTLALTLKQCREDRDYILLDTDYPEQIQDLDKLQEFLDAVKRAERGEETDEDLLFIAYQTDYVYYTEWDDEDDFQYVEINGELMEL